MIKWRIVTYTRIEIEGHKSRRVTEGKPVFNTYKEALEVAQEADKNWPQLSHHVERVEVKNNLEE